MNKNGRKKCLQKPQIGQSLVENRPKVAVFWDYSQNGGLTPKDVCSNSYYKFHWKCPVCGHKTFAPVCDKMDTCVKCCNLNRKMIKNLKLAKDGFKICGGPCKQKKTVDNFPTDNKSEDKLYYACKECCSQWTLKSRYSSLESALKRIIAKKKHHAKSRNLEFDIDYEWLYTKYVETCGCCEITGMRFLDLLIDLKNRNGVQLPWNLMTLDRIDATKGYTKDNVKLLLFSVNTFKGILNENSLEDLQILYEISSKMAEYFKNQINRKKS